MVTQNHPVTRDKQTVAEPGQIAMPGTAGAEANQAGNEREDRFARQPATGFLSLLVVGAIWILLAVIPGAAWSVPVLGVLTTVGLPVLILIAAWWRGWPGSYLGSRAGAGLLNTAVLVAATVVLTALDQAVVGHVDMAAIFGQPDARFPLSPALMPLAVTTLVTLAVLTFVCDRWPFQRLPPVPAGFAALAVSWGAGVLASATLVNWNSVPVAIRSQLRVRVDAGFASPLNLVSWLVCVVVFVFAFNQTLGGWPASHCRSQAARLLAGNTFVLAAATGTFLAARHLLGWSPPLIIAGAGSVIAAISITSIVFEGFPFRSARPHLTRTGLAFTTLAVTLIVFAILHLLGTALAQLPAGEPVDLWIGVSGMNYIVGAALLYHLVWHRWPLPAP